MAVAIDKYICPFCGQKTLFVGVHDDEGNYKGRPGCEYESDPWSGLCYAIHHDGWGDCILCTDAHDLPLGGCFFDTAEEAFQAIPTLTQPNEWVNAKDNPPQLTGKYICCVEDTHGHMWSIPADYLFEMKTWVGEFGEIKNKVVYWMPLPAPPDRRPPEGEKET